MVVAVAVVAAAVVSVSVGARVIGGCTVMMAWS